MLEEFPLELFLWSVLAVVYMAVRTARGTALRTALHDLGVGAAGWRWYPVAAAVAVFGVLLHLPLAGLLADLAGHPDYAQSHYSDWRPGAVAAVAAFARELVHRSLGEELFFRGLLAGLLFRRMRFSVANLLQSLLFLLPHTLILPLAGWRFWPLLVPVLVSGWLLGWLRHRSSSIFPGVLAHALANAWAALYVMAA